MREELPTKVYLRSVCTRFLLQTVQWLWHSVLSVLAEKNSKESKENKFFLCLRKDKQNPTDRLQGWITETRD